jgi:SAM-dependent methyltransferase
MKFRVPWSGDRIEEAPKTPEAEPPKPKPGKAGGRGNYWARRREMMYYRYVLVLAGQFAREARSLIDVGSHQTSIAEELDWIPERAALDRGAPYASERVRGIQADFLTFEPERRFDFALCLQVLEHVPDAPAFARKLLAVADRVLVSVPYKWPAGTHPEHCQDPVDARKLARWFGREPDHQLVVTEPFGSVRSGRRLIAYFHDPRETFELKRYRPAAGRERPR